MSVQHGGNAAQLSGYDEFFVHQASEPFTQTPSTDYAWDDGMFVSIFDTAKRVHVYAGLRVNPNSGMIGGYAGIVHKGQMRTIRFKRPWGPIREEPDLSLRVGPFTYAVTKPLSEIVLTLADNVGGLTFELTFEGIAPAWVEPHRLYRNRGRATTDQTRYLQSGTGYGRIVIDGEEIQLVRNEAFAFRDHSWGLYYERPPLAPRRKWLRPSEAKLQPFRIFVVFCGTEATAAFQVNEDASGGFSSTEDVLSVPFTGHVRVNAGEYEVLLTEGSHELEFEPGTRIMTKGIVHLKDERGEQWSMEFDDGIEPFLAHPPGYAIGSWKDGGNISSYPGTDDVVVEFDEFDLTSQPCPEPIYGQDKVVEAIGTEYAFTTRLIGPDGQVFDGQGFFEMMTNGRYDRYGFTDDGPPEWLNMYHLMDE